MSAGVTRVGQVAIPETHPLYMGVYAGALGDDERAASYVEDSDCQVLAGVPAHRYESGIYSARLEQSRSIT